jgi:DNA-binding transcriptional LysR family regulator
MPPVDVDQILAFVTIAQLGSFTRAATMLHRSQPAISRRMELLEGELGAPLIERTRSSLQLTEVGRAFLPHAESMLAAIHDGQEAARVAARDGEAVLTLALVGTLLDTQIVELLRRFRHRSKRVRVDLRTATSQGVSQLVRRGDACMGVRYFVDPSATLISHTIADETMRVVVSAKHPLIARRSRLLRELDKQRWIGFPVARRQPESFGNILRARLGLIGLADADVMAVDSLSAQKRLVAAGFGVALLPESSIRDELRKGTLRALEGSPLEIKIPIVLIHRRNGYLSPASNALLAALNTKRA